MLVHDLRNVVVASVEEIGYPEFCYVVEDGRESAVFRVGKESRVVSREVEKFVTRLRRHARGEMRLEDDARRLLSFLWERGESREIVCARRLNYSSRRLRKLAEALIGAGYLLPCRLGEGRRYVAIRPLPGTRR